MTSTYTNGTDGGCIDNKDGGGDDGGGGQETVMSSWHSCYGDTDENKNLSQRKRCNRARTGCDHTVNDINELAAKKALQGNTMPTMSEAKHGYDNDSASVIGGKNILGSVGIKG